MSETGAPSTATTSMLESECTNAQPPEIKYFIPCVPVDVSIDSDSPQHHPMAKLMLLSCCTESTRESNLSLTTNRPKL